MQNRIFVCLIPILAAGHAVAQDLSQTITYRTMAVPASRAIADIAKASHVDLAVTSPLDSQPLIVSLTDVPLKEAMDRIAGVLHGRWLQNKSAYTLQRPDDLADHLQQSVFQERLSLIQRYMASLLADRPTTALDEATAETILRRQKHLRKEDEKPHGAPGKEPTDEEMQAKQEARQKQSAFDYHLSAQGRLMDRIYQAIDPSILATSPPNQELVFSSNPKPLQYKLQMSAEDVQELIQEQNLWTVVDKRINPDNYANDPPGMDSRHLIDVNDARVIAIVQPNDRGAPGEVTGYVIDSKGRSLVDSQWSGELTWNFDYSTGDETLDFSKWTLPVVKLSPLAREFMTLAVGQRNTGVGEMRPASSELHSFLLDASNRDPLSLQVSEGLLACAEAKGWNLVASPSDSMALTNYYGQADRIDAADLLTDATDSADCAVSLSGAWLTLQPRHPLDAESERTDRASLSAALKSIDDQGYASIDGMSAYAASNGANNDTSLLRQYISLCYPDLQPFEHMSFSDLRLYGLHSDDQRRVLSQGSKISLNELSSVQQAALFATIQNPSLMIGGPGNGFYGANRDDGLSGLMSSDFDRGEPIWSSYTQPTRSPEDSPNQSQMDDMDFYYEKPLNWNYSEIVGIDPSATLTLGVASAEGDEICARDLPRISPVGGLDGPGPTQHWTSVRSVADDLTHPRGDLITYASCPARCIQIQLGVANKFTVIENIIEHGSGMTPFEPVTNLPKHLRVLIEVEAKKMQGTSSREQDTEALPLPNQKPPRPVRHD